MKAIYIGKLVNQVNMTRIGLAKCIEILTKLRILGSMGTYPSKHSPQPMSFTRNKCIQHKIHLLYLKAYADFVLGGKFTYLFLMATFTFDEICFTIARPTME